MSKREREIAVRDFLRRAQTRLDAKQTNKFCDLESCWRALDWLWALQAEIALEPDLERERLDKHSGSAK